MSAQDLSSRQEKNRPTNDTGVASLTIVRWEIMEYELSFLQLFLSPIPVPGRLDPKMGREWGVPEADCMPIPQPHIEREDKSKGRLCPNPHLKVIKSLAWHKLKVGDNFESDIILEFLNGLECVLITTHYREIMLSVQSLFRGSHIQQEGDLEHVSKVTSFYLCSSFN